MAVFTFRFMDEIQKSVERIASPLLNSCALVLSPEEFIDAFIDPSHVLLLKQTQAVVGSVGFPSADQKYLLQNFSRALVSVEFGDDEPPIILPAYISDGVLPTAPQEIRHKIYDWLQRRYVIGRILGDALDALHWLNDHCSNVASMDLYFPAMRTIINNCIRYPDQASWERVRPRLDAKPRKVTLKIPEQVLKRMAECSAVLTGAAAQRFQSGAMLPRMHARMRMVSVITTESDFIYSHFGVQKKASFV